ncbi:MAG: helix-turn-helix domain-containing protein [SAR324 cluster bacterium]|nr:helix-turn-helix domain-containing protein [SAR324 cluster bacterium]
MTQQIRKSESTTRLHRHAALLLALGARVRARRNADGMTRRVLAERSHLSPRFLAQLEAGRANISLINLASIAEALDIELPLLLAEALGGPPEAAREVSVLHTEIQAALGNASPARLKKLLNELRVDTQGIFARPVIALVGLRGTGKSTIGPLLADSLGIPFVELDDMIQDITGLALQEIFELHGERYYRIAEGQALEKLTDRARPVLVAVSGGIVTDPASFELLRSRTLLVWLRAEPRLYMERVLLQGDRRPMEDRPDAMAELLQLLEQRSSLYAQAHLNLDTSRLAPRDCALRLMEAIRLEQVAG